MLLTGKTSNTILLAQRLAFTISIDFGDEDFVFDMRECIRNLFVYRCKILIRDLVISEWIVELDTPCNDH